MANSKHPTMPQGCHDRTVLHPLVMDCGCPDLRHTKEQKSTGLQNQIGVLRRGARGMVSVRLNQILRERPFGEMLWTVPMQRLVQLEGPRAGQHISHAKPLFRSKCDACRGPCSNLYPENKPTPQKPTTLPFQGKNLAAQPTLPFQSWKWMFWRFKRGT